MQHVGNVGEWRLLRFEYNGAPLQAEHPRRRNARHVRLGLGDADGWTVEIDSSGDLVFDGLDDAEIPCVPGAVLKALVDDAIARGVWK